VQTSRSRRSAQTATATATRHRRMREIRRAFDMCRSSFQSSVCLSVCLSFTESSVIDDLSCVFHDTLLVSHTASALHTVSVDHTHSLTIVFTFVDRQLLLSPPTTSRFFLSNSVDCDCSKTYQRIFMKLVPWTGRPDLYLYLYLYWYLYWYLVL